MRKGLSNGACSFFVPFGTVISFFKKTIILKYIKIIFFKFIFNIDISKRSIIIKIKLLKTFF